MNRLVFFSFLVNVALAGPFAKYAENRDLTPGGGGDFAGDRPSFGEGVKFPKDQGSAVFPEQLVEERTSDPEDGNQILNYGVDRFADDHTGVGSFKFVPGGVKFVDANEHKDPERYGDLLTLKAKVDASARPVTEEDGSALVEPDWYGDLELLRQRIKSDYSGAAENGHELLDHMEDPDWYGDLATLKLKVKRAGADLNFEEPPNEVE